MGPSTGLSTEISEKTDGFIINPMRYPEASKLAIYSIADYTWNTQSYKTDESWNKALKDLMPANYEHLQFFAMHNTDAGVRFFIRQISFA